MASIKVYPGDPHAVFKQRIHSLRKKKPGALAPGFFSGSLKMFVFLLYTGQGS